jgi:hypothetical protein
MISARNEHFLCSVTPPANVQLDVLLLLTQFVNRQILLEAYAYT